MTNTPMSPVGAALFDMLKDMGESQARIFAEGPLTPERLQESRTAVEMTAIAHRPNVMASLKQK